MGAAHLILLFLYHSYILLPYIHIDVYTTIHIYAWRCNISIWLTCGACFTFTFIYLSISVSDFDLTFHPLVVIHRLLFCKGIVGREHGKHRNKSY